MHVQQMRPAEMKQAMPPLVRLSETSDAGKTGGRDNFWRVLLPAPALMGAQINSLETTKKISRCNAKGNPDSGQVQTEEEPVQKQTTIAIPSKKTQGLPSSRSTSKDKQVASRTADGPKRTKQDSGDDVPEASVANSEMHSPDSEAISIVPAGLPSGSIECEKGPCRPEEESKIAGAEMKSCSMRSEVNGSKGEADTSQLEGAAGKQGPKAEMTPLASKAVQDNLFAESKIVAPSSNLGDHGDSRRDPDLMTLGTTLDRGGRERLEFGSNSAPKTHIAYTGVGSLSSTAPETLAAGPRLLEVGVLDATLGWLKIRAELGVTGGVSASMTAGTLAHERLRDTVPEITGFLAAEAVKVERISVHKSPEETSYLQRDASLAGNSRESERRSPSSQGGAMARVNRTTSQRDGRLLMDLSTRATTPSCGSLYKGSWLSVTA